ncbi:TniQ family protein, partial [Bacillus sp. JJ664]
MNYSSRSILYGLVPFQINTCYVESLSSYIIRLAEAHVVDVSSLLKFMVFPNLGKQYLFNSIERGGNRFYDGSRSINGLDSNALEIVNVMSELTNVEGLNNLTLLSYKLFFSNRDLLKNTLYWCPSCLDEFYLDNPTHVYYPLIWSLKNYKVCIKHNSYLIKNCSNCKMNIPYIHRKSRVGFCCYCNSKIFGIKDMFLFPDKKDYYVSNCLEHFFTNV